MCEGIETACILHSMAGVWSICCGTAAAVCGLQSLISHYGLRQSANACPQTYALGIKEVWEVPEEVRVLWRAVLRGAVLCCGLSAVSAVHIS